MLTGRFGLGRAEVEGWLAEEWAAATTTTTTPIGTMGTTTRMMTMATTTPVSTPTPTGAETGAPGVSPARYQQLPESPGERQQHGLRLLSAAATAHTEAGCGEAGGRSPTASALPIIVNPDRCENDKSRAMKSRDQDFPSQERHTDEDLIQLPPPVSARTATGTTSCCPTSLESSSEFSSSSSSH
ncbi:hypothetical protein Micbo1qcDRAFT_168762, partial [Microdochium bolleyi]